MKRTLFIAAVVLACGMLSAQNAPKTVPTPKCKTVPAGHGCNICTVCQGSEITSCTAVYCSPRGATRIIHVKPEEPEHRWASDLDGKKEADGTVWYWNHIEPTVVRATHRCTKIERQPWEPSPAVQEICTIDEVKESYTIDVCILHGETRVLRKEK